MKTTDSKPSQNASQNKNDKKTAPTDANEVIQRLTGFVTAGLCRDRAIKYLGRLPKSGLSARSLSLVELLEIELREHDKTRSALRTAIALLNMSRNTARLAREEADARLAQGGINLAWAEE